MLVEDTETATNEAGIHDYISRQFASPEGSGGVAVAAMMRLINWIPNSGAIRLLDPSPTDDILEIGFGPGYGLKKLGKFVKDGTVTGIDRSRTMVDVASARNRRAIDEGRIRVKQASFEDLPIANGSIDGILAVNVFYFVDPMSFALAEARRVLRPGGSLVIYVTDRSFMSSLQFDGRETKHTFDKRSLYRLLRTSGFHADQIEIRGMWLPFRFRGILAKVTKPV